MVDQIKAQRLAESILNLLKETDFETSIHVLLKTTEAILQNFSRHELEFIKVRSLLVKVIITWDYEGEHKIH